MDFNFMQKCIANSNQCLKESLKMFALTDISSNSYTKCVLVRFAN